MTYEQAYDPTIRWGANPKWGRGPSQAKSFASKGQQRSALATCPTMDPHPVFLNFFTESRLCFKQSNNFVVNTASVPSTHSRKLWTRVQYLNRSLFAGIAFARVIILYIRKPNGVCCPVSVSLFSEALETRPALSLQCTKA